MVISNGIPAVPRNRKLSEVRSKPFRGRKTTRNSVPLNKIRSKLLEFPSNSSAEEKTTRIPFRGKKIEALCRWFRFAQLAKGKKFRP